MSTWNDAVQLAVSKVSHSILKDLDTSRLDANREVRTAEIKAHIKRFIAKHPELVKELVEQFTSHAASTAYETSVKSIRKEEQ